MSEDPSPSLARPPGEGEPAPKRRIGGLRAWFKGLFGRNGDHALREAFEEILEEHDTRETPIDRDERALIANILALGDKTAYDVMVPRADIVAIEDTTRLDDAVAVMVKSPHSRYPLYRDSLDDITGFVHLKDLLGVLHRKRRPALKRLKREVLFVAPSMRVLDLLLTMRAARQHMAVVVDEFGGVDGLVTIEDLVEEIVGEIEDEHDVEEGPLLTRSSEDGPWTAHARLPLEDLEATFGPILTEEEREEDLDTLGGLVFTLAGRVPGRGEVIPHPASGMEFEVLDADPRRVKRLRLLGTPPVAGHGAD